MHISERCWYLVRRINNHEEKKNIQYVWKDLLRRHSSMIHAFFDTMMVELTTIIYEQLCQFWD